MTTIIATTTPTGPTACGYVLAAMFFALVIAAYFAPLFVARMRRKVDGVLDIFIVNLLFGWTGFGWLVAFIWAFTGQTESDLRLLDALSLNKTLSPEVVGVA